MRTEAVVVTRGPYAPVLLDVRIRSGLQIGGAYLIPPRAQAWNEFKARPDKQSENDFPGQARPFRASVPLPHLI